MKDAYYIAAFALVFGLLGYQSLRLRDAETRLDKLERWAEEAIGYWPWPETKPAAWQGPAGVADRQGDGRGQ